MSDPQRVAVVGATGYAGFELAQLLLRHPKIQKRGSRPYRTARNVFLLPTNREERYANKTLLGSAGPALRTMREARPYLPRT